MVGTCLTQRVFLDRRTSTIVIGWFLELVLSTICIFVYYSYTIMILNIYIYTPWICLTICYSQFAVGTSQYQVWWPMFWSSSGQVGRMSIPQLFGGFDTHPMSLCGKCGCPNNNPMDDYNVPHDNWDMGMGQYL